MRIFTFLLFLIPILSFGQIAAWDFTGESTVPTSTAEVFDANLAGSPTLTRGSSAAESAGGNSFRTVGFQNDGIATTNNDYFENTFTAATGYTLSLTTIDARFAGTATFSASPGVSMQYAYSLDGTTFTLIGAPFLQIGNGNMAQIDLSGISDLQNVPDNVTVTIRFYASGQTTTGGWGYNSASAGTYGLAFGGSVDLAVAGCNITGAGLTAVTCNDNGTPTDDLDDYVSFSLNPTGADLGTNYSVAVSSGTITPLTAAYGAATAFQLQNGSAGAGNVTVTITDDADPACSLEVVITDPGVCSSAIPVITLNPTLLTGFTQIVGTPSAEQQFTASGIALADDITLTAPANYEISLTSVVGFTNVIVLPQTGGTVASTDIYVRANAGAYGTINETITGASAGATDATVDLEGFADDYIVYTIGEISTVDANGVADSLGVLVELTGVVHCMDFDGNAGYSITLIDANNDGINMFNFNDVSGYTTPMAGDSITIRGVIAQFNGLTQVDVNFVSVLALGAATWAPTVVTTLDESTESQYITIMGLTLVTPIATFPTGNNNIDVTDGTTTFTMRIDADTDIPGTAAPTGTFNLTGVGGQFDNSAPYTSGYQIFPCGTSSFETVCDGTNTPNNAVTVVAETITAIATGVSYQWIDCSDDSEINGETGMSFTATADGEYAVIVSNAECSDTSVCEMITIDTSNLNEVEAIGLVVYPNPTNGVLNIRFNGTEGALILTDLAGKIAFTTTVESNEAIDLSGLSAGTYLLNLTVNGMVTTERISVK